MRESSRSHVTHTSHTRGSSSSSSGSSTKHKGNSGNNDSDNDDNGKSEQEKRQHARKELTALVNMRKPKPGRLQSLQDRIDSHKVDPGKYNIMLVIGGLAIAGATVWGIKYLNKKRGCHETWGKTDYTKCFTDGPPCSSKAEAKQKRQNITQHMKWGSLEKCGSSSTRHIACNKSGACKLCKKKHMGQCGGDNS